MFGRKKTRKKMLKCDLDTVHDILSYINHSAVRTANMGSDHKKRLMLEGDEVDGQYMEICDAVTVQLKEAYETLYSIVEAKQGQLKVK
tara:strand:- start:924 stop:1187 length:264 start_codon:yes stop_codon:yes gene_type:complete